MSQTSEVSLTVNGTFSGSVSGTPTVNMLLRGSTLPGTPVPLPGSRLPANHCWADRSLILFADWPDLKNVYDTGLLDVLPADATEQDRTLYPRKWVLNAEGDGLLLPDIGGRFARDWRPDQSHDAQRAAGTRQGDAIRNITGQAYLCSGAGDYAGGVIYSASDCFSCSTKARGAHNAKAAVDTSTRYSYLNFDASSVVPTAEENRPLNDAQPVAIYMGRNAADIAPEPPLAPAAALRLLARYDTAGDFSWTVPDLYGGQSYPVYVRMKGAGAGGYSAGRINTANYSGRGGGEGCLVEFDLTVTPGESHCLIVGLGGAGGTLTPNTGYSGSVTRIPGAAGGDSIFGDISTAPGAPGWAGGRKIASQGRAEIVTSGACGSAHSSVANTWGLPRTPGGGQGGGTDDRFSGGADDGVCGGGGSGGGLIEGKVTTVSFQSGGKGGDGFIEIYTR